MLFAEKKITRQTINLVSVPLVASKMTVRLGFQRKADLELPGSVSERALDCFLPAPTFPSQSMGAEKPDEETGL